MSWYPGVAVLQTFEMVVVRAFGINKWIELFLMSMCFSIQKWHHLLSKQTILLSSYSFLMQVLPTVKDVAKISTIKLSTFGFDFTFISLHVSTLRQGPLQVILHQGCQIWKWEIGQSIHKNWPKLAISKLKNGHQLAKKHSFFAFNLTYS